MILSVSSARMTGLRVGLEFNLALRQVCGRPFNLKFAISSQLQFRGRDITVTGDIPFRDKIMKSKIK